MIRVQKLDFDVGAELAHLATSYIDVGCVASFLGLVRGKVKGTPLIAMTLEHYPGMTERRLAEIEDEARHRWPLRDVLIVHRVGRLRPGERIVLAATAASHRDVAFEACQFLIDWLKTSAPFWKLEETVRGTIWVRSCVSDIAKATRWNDKI